MIIERRKIFYIISLILIVPGIISLFINGLNLGIDFRGGSIVNVRMAAEVSAPEVPGSLGHGRVGTGRSAKRAQTIPISSAPVNWIRSRPRLCSMP